MKREEKNVLIDNLCDQINTNNHFYLTDISDLNAFETSDLRRKCFTSKIKLVVVKNTLLKLALDKAEKDYKDLYDILKGSTSIMFSETGNAPAKLIKEFRKTHERPVLKAAFVEESVYIGDEQLELLTNIKSKEELIADVVMLLQSPIKNLTGALMSAGNNLTGALKTISEKAETKDEAEAKPDTEAKAETETKDEDEAKPDTEAEDKEKNNE